MTDYQPVSCDLHSQLELFAIRKTALNIALKESEHSHRGIIVDVVIHDGAEYLVLEDGTEVRLDRIDHISPAT